MARREIVGRGQQVGLVLASAAVPGTFTRSLSERTWMDQGLITGLATGTHFLLTVMAQDAIDAGGTALSTALPFPDSWTLQQREQASTLLLDMAVVPLGFGLVAYIGHRSNESAARGLMRQLGWRTAVTGVGATILAASMATTGWLDDALGADGKIKRFPLAIPVGIATALVLENVRQRETPAEHYSDPARSSPALGLAAGAGVVMTMAGLAIGEAKLARELGTVGSRVLPGSENTWRRLVHVATLAAVAAGTNQLWKRAMHDIEAGTAKYDEGVDETASGLWTSPYQSGDPASYVAWDSMGREGRRHVVTWVRPEPLLDRPAELKGVARPELSIRTVMKAEAKATPIAIFIGLDSADTATERVELALKEMDRTDAWSRELIMLDVADRHGIRQLRRHRVRAVHDAGQHGRGDAADSKRPSPLSLGKVGQARGAEPPAVAEDPRADRADGTGGSRPKVVHLRRVPRALTRARPGLEGWGTLGPQALGHRPRPLDRHPGGPQVAARPRRPGGDPTSTRPASPSSTTTRSSCALGYDAKGARALRAAQPRQRRRHEVRRRACQPASGLARDRTAPGSRRCRVVRRAASPPRCGGAR